MGLNKIVDLSPIQTELDTAIDQLNINTTDLSDHESRITGAETNITDLFLSDIDQNAINRVYFRREKSGSTTIPIGSAPVNVQFDYQTQGNLKGMISTSDAITFTFNGNGVFLINAVVSFTDIVLPESTLGYCITNLILGGGQKMRRLCGDHPNGNVGNLTLQGSTILIASDGLTFKVQATCVDSGTILGHVTEARTYLEVFQL